MLLMLWYETYAITVIDIITSTHPLHMSMTFKFHCIEKHFYTNQGQGLFSGIGQKLKADKTPTQAVIAKTQGFSPQQEVNKQCKFNGK